MANDRPRATCRSMLRNQLLLSAAVLGGVSVLAGQARAGEIETMFRAADVAATPYYVSDADAPLSVDRFAKLWGDGNTLLFADLSGASTDGDVVGSATFGIRTRIAPDMVLGFTGSIDREYGASGAAFQGASFGAELLTPTWDFRARAVLPDNTWGLASPNATFVGFGENTRIRSSWERALPGAEFEIGYTFSDDDGFDLRVFGGGFAFADSDMSVTGAKAGVEARLAGFELFGISGDLSLSGEAAWDAAREATGYAGFHLSVPFGGSEAESAYGADSRALFESRVRRGLNSFVTSTTDVLSVGYAGAGIDRVMPKQCEPNPRKGIVCPPPPTLTIWYADASGDGDGSFANPESLADAIALAGTNGYVVAIGNDGPIAAPGTGATLLNGQWLVGGGTSVSGTVIVRGSPKLLNVTTQGTRGTLTGIGAATVTLAEGNRVQNLDFGGESTVAIYGMNLLAATIVDVDIDVVRFGNGIVFDWGQSGGTSTIVVDNAIVTGGNGGIQFTLNPSAGSGRTVNASVSNSTIANSPSTSFALLAVSNCYTVTGACALNVSLTNNVFSGGALWGLGVYAQNNNGLGPSTTTTITGSGNSFSSFGTAAVYMLSRCGSVNVTLTNTTITGTPSATTLHDGNCGPVTSSITPPP